MAVAVRIEDQVVQNLQDAVRNDAYGQRFLRQLCGDEIAVLFHNRPAEHRCLLQQHAEIRRNRIHLVLAVLGDVLHLLDHPAHAGEGVYPG